MASLGKIIDVHSHIITNLGSQVPTRKRPPWSIEQSMSLMRWQRYRRWRRQMGRGYKTI
jgi:hypothetical protein